MLSNRVAPYQSPPVWHIVITLAAKDVVDAVRNKTILTMILGLSIMLLSVQALPLLLRMSNRTVVAIYDQERTSLADQIRSARLADVRELRSADDVAREAQDSTSKLISVHLPAAWSQESGPLTVNAYVVHWLSDSDEQSLISQAETLLSRTMDRPITIQPTVVYPDPSGGGHGVMVGIGLVIVIVMMSAIMVPILLVEEKSAHTLEVLQLSPASTTHIIVAKGIAGMLYGLLAAIILLLMNLRLVHLWWVMIPAILGSALLASCLGLLIGVFSENESTIQLWVGALCVLFLFPPLIGAFSGRLPDWAARYLDLLPTLAMIRLFRISFSASADPVWVMGQLAIIIIWVAVMLLIMIRRLGRLS